MPNINDNLISDEMSDKIIDESDRTAEEVCSELKSFLTEELNNKRTVPIDVLLNERYNKFRKIGAVS